MRFLPHTAGDVREMLAAIGADSVEALFENVPAELRKTARIDLPDGLTEQEVCAALERLAGRNGGAAMPAFLGGGAYPHFVPAAVDQILRRAEFYSSYTPYQPEVSQGTLQAVFEFQTMTAMLLGLEVANASMYDGASATAEAVLMALRLQPKRRRVVLARSLHPEYRQVVATYLEGAGAAELVQAPFGADGRIDAGWLSDNLRDDVAALVVGHPNFFGAIEDLQHLQGVAQKCGAVLVTATAEALALAAIRAPGSYGVDIAVAEGQSLGVPLSYGGPGVGLFATRMKHVRNMPGRLIGEAFDEGGRRGYVLTLATREQHIRREKATSNICTNQGLIALAVTVYLSLLGRKGLRQLALANLERAHRTCERLCAGGRWKQRFAAPFFNEFVLQGSDAAEAVRRAAAAGVLAGVPLGRWYPELEDCVALAVTEVHDEAAIDRLVEVFA